MLYTEEAVKANIRNRDGRRVFYRAAGDTLTSGAQDYLRRKKIEILSAELARPEVYRLLGGGYVREKGEHLTHLAGDILVPKTHPRIVFRGAMDALEAQILLTAYHLPKFRPHLSELLALARQIVRAEVLEEALPMGKLFGLTAQELRERSHFPQNYYAQPHFMPEVDDGEEILRLNVLRTIVRTAERYAVAPFWSADGAPMRTDIPQALNRMSSAVYLLMIEAKAEGKT